MKTFAGLSGIAIAVILNVGLMLLFPRTSGAHCDTLDGPVVTDARIALERGDVTPVLKWVKGENEGEIREAFEKALTIRQKYPDAKDFADMYFFETLVRVHRMGEGAPYDGLKPPGEVEPAIQEADMALAQGSVEELLSKMTELVRRGIEARFAETMEAKAHKDGDVEAGREFVAAYVEFIHYVERLHKDAAGGTSHQGEAAPEDAGHAHDH